MDDREIVHLGWSDYVGLTRCAACRWPRSSGAWPHGLGWAVAGQALTPFADIADNPWGPDAGGPPGPGPATTHTRVDLWDDVPPFHLYLCDSRNPMARRGTAARAGS